MAPSSLLIWLLLVSATQADSCQKSCVTINQTFSCESSECLEVPSLRYATPVSVLLRNNSIERVYEMEEDDCAQAKYIDLSQNIISWIDYGAFEVCKQLETLNLTSNELKAITSNHFLGLSGTRLLYLAHNKIASVETNAFKECAILKYLDLSDNQIGNLTDTVFSGLTNLTNLYLDNNRLTYLESSLFRMRVPGLEVLDLRNNQIEQMDHMALNDLKDLFNLQLTGNKLKALNPYNFVGLPSLAFLHLAHNEISILNGSVFLQLNKLKILDLMHNRITGLDPDVFHGLRSLQKLELGGNQLTRVPTPLSSLGSLREVFLNYNPITEIPPRAFPESTLEVFLEQMPKLEVVRHAAFEGLLHLRKVYIQGCPKLSTIDADAFGDGDKKHEVPLVVLKLSNNNLKTLDGGLINWTKLETLDLSSNPWVCDCSLGWTKDVETAGMECHDPRHLRGQDVSSVRSFSCSSRSSVGIALIAAATAAFIAVSACLCYKYKYRVFPCCFESPGRYKMIFKNNDEADDPTFNPMEIKRADGAQLVEHGPTPV